MLVSIVNGAGIVFESIYVLIFLIFAPKKEKTKIFGLLVLVITMLAADVLVSILVLHGSKRKVFAGIATTVFSIMMYGSPLSVMRLVIQTRSVEYMPFFLSLSVFLCATSWLIYGVIGKDTFIIIPNSFGCVLGAMQLILYAIYHRFRDTRG
ncbi:hypothetical protein ACH5RR_014678 [Cinchona calisaya]|uniref:Uncharacterized protein n=1 Tax=Cinchona calisaya TaxID=153742 RepID=A0ABD2ZR01_9GENT